MRSIWKGVISFGLVSIPVRLYSATQERDVAFHQVRRSDGSRIRYRRVAEADGGEVSYADIAKGYELPDGQTVVLTDEDFANLPLSTSKAIDVLEFVPLEQVDPIYFAKSYYVEPDRTGAKPYVLLRDALAESGRVALVKIALRQREQLATLRVRDGVFVLETMIWPDEVREPDFPFLDEEVEVRPQELAMASSLIETLAADFDPGRFSDEYRDALQAVIDAKIAGREIVSPPGAEEREPVGDLMAALRASIAAARKDHPNGAAADEEPAAQAADGDSAAGRGATAGRRAAGRTAAGKAPAGKTPAGRTAAGKTPAGRAAAGRTAAGKSTPNKTTPNKTTPNKNTGGKTATGKTTTHPTRRSA
ncbi:Non-homologous end joining protein Ku [Frankia canadensis]|uniref:Non-homologous end joining protein Ku n=1 Tax=Frankia canadensis TaxID=1836972 RepID=A0A2I2KJS4_9ACTN|nr:Ku protein [Frankia canadensis]SNQ45897.1 Non-homologous end joining protein Ku [Frankia canadensis]SOU53187.1 Non-homologous end joining protein Ku [Frankia canadensis]